MFYNTFNSPSYLHPTPSVPYLALETLLNPPFKRPISNNSNTHRLLPVETRPSSLWRNLHALPNLPHLPSPFPLLPPHPHPDPPLPPQPVLLSRPASKLCLSFLPPCLPPLPSAPSPVAKGTAGSAGGGVVANAEERLKLMAERKKEKENAEQVGLLEGWVTQSEATRSTIPLSL